MDYLFDTEITVVKAPGQSGRSFVFWECAELATQAEVFVGGGESRSDICDLLMTAFNISKKGALKLWRRIKWNGSRCEIDGCHVVLTYQD